MLDIGNTAPSRSKSNMRPNRVAITGIIALIALTAMNSPALCDEGMWLFNNPPKKLLKEKYNFEPSDKWLTNLQHSAVRFNSGGSGAFVSPTGLVLTNHH